MRLPFRFLMLLASLLILPARADNELQVVVQRNRAAEQAFFDIRASGFARATPDHVWQVLTDYERQPEYVPNLSSARVVSRNGADVVLEQNGQGGFFFIRHAIHLLIRVTERAPSMIDVSLISGNMKRYGARWQLTPAEQAGMSGTRIEYSGIIEPDFFVPPLVGNAIVQGDVRKMLEAVIAQLEK
jgi:ribosome-associated toxin RatA of RatAB toxin-antitoxin module